MKYVIILDNSNSLSGEKGAPIAGYTRSLGNGLHYSDEIREFSVKGFMRELKYIQKNDRITQDQKSLILKNVMFLPSGRNVKDTYRNLQDKAATDFFLIDSKYPEIFGGILGFSVVERVSEVLEHVNSIFANFSSLDFVVFSIFQDSSFNHEIKINGQAVTVDRNWIDLKVREKNINQAAYGPNSLEILGTTFLAIDPFLDKTDLYTKYRYPFIRETVLLINESGLELSTKDSLGINRFEQIVKNSILSPQINFDNIKNPFMSKVSGKSNMRLAREFDEYIKTLKQTFSSKYLPEVTFTSICNVRCGVIDKVLTFKSIVKDEKGNRKVFDAHYNDSSDMIAKFVPNLVNLSSCAVVNSDDVIACNDVRIARKLSYTEQQMKLYSLAAIKSYFTVKGINVKVEVHEGNGCTLEIVK